MPFLHFRFLLLHFCPGCREATFTQNPWNPWVLSVVDQSVMVSPRDRNASPGRGPQECNGCTGWRHRSVGRTTQSGDGASQRWLSSRALIRVLVGDTDLLVARPDLGTGHRSAGCPRERTRCTGWRHRSVGRTTRSGDGASQRWLSPRAHTVYWIETAICCWHSPNSGQGLLALPVPYRNQSGNPT